MKRTTATTTALRPLRRILLAVVVAGALMGLATACEPPGCAKDCITSVVISPGTTTYTVTTTDKAKVVVTLYNEATRTNMVASRASNSFLTKHVISNGAVTPNRTYWYRVKATDEAGKVYQEDGSFRAAKRTVSLKITSITLTDDSDSVGTGELDFGLRFAGVDHGTVYTNHDFGSGTVKSGLSIVRTIANDAPAVFTADLEGQDDDCEGIGSLCTGGGAYGYDNGSNDDFDWATASTGNLVMPGENASGTWSAVTSAYALKFSVAGTWTVSYTA